MDTSVDLLEGMTLFLIEGQGLCSSTRRFCRDFATRGFLDKILIHQGTDKWVPVTHVRSYFIGSKARGMRFDEFKHLPLFWCPIQQLSDGFIRADSVDGLGGGADMLLFFAMPLGGQH